MQCVWHLSSCHSAGVGGCAGGTVCVEVLNDLVSQPVWAGDVTHTHTHTHTHTPVCTWRPGTAVHAITVVHRSFHAARTQYVTRTICVQTWWRASRTSALAVDVRALHSPTLHVLSEYGANVV